MIGFIKIYVLVDPITNAVRYVGQTNNISKRYNSHISDIRSNLHKCNWIKSLKDNGLLPKIFVIGEYTKDMIDFWEIFWISHYRQCGCSLTNMTDGGRSRQGYKWSNETRIKFIKTMTGRKSSLVTRKKLSLAHTGKKMSDEAKTKMRVNNLGKKMSDEAKTKMSLAHTGKTKSIDTILNMRKARPNKQSVTQCDISGNVIHIWESISDAARELNIFNSNIVKCLKGSRNSTGGFMWKYTNKGDGCGNN